MIQGFFTPEETKRTSLEVVSDTPKCGACGLYKKCKTPKMKPTNPGKPIMVVSDRPGVEEDKQGRPLIGETSAMLSRLFSKYGVSIHHDVSLTYSTICHSESPPSNAVDYCRPNLVNAIKKQKPKVIILLGGSAVFSLVPFLWKDDRKEMDKWMGWRIPSQKLNAWVCPTYHPSFLLHSKNPYFEREFRNHIKKALSLKSRPFRDKRKLSDDEVGILYNRKDIKKAIEKMMDEEYPIAFDYETNCIKPYNSYAAIRCIGMSNGVRTIAFLIQGNEEIVRDFLKSDHAKIGQNTKFEDEWSKEIFGVWPKNVRWCGMINAHLISPTIERGITTVKFQSFVRFGVPAYEEAIKPYLEGKGSYGINRVFDAPEKTLLKYCGMDALVEWWVDHAQMKDMGFPVTLPEDRIP